jgi:hypothetical protein
MTKNHKSRYLLLVIDLRQEDAGDGSAANDASGDEVSYSWRERAGYGGSTSLASGVSVLDMVKWKQRRYEIA